ncbi:MAG TPA: polyphosphate kinase 1 [Steroidobacteraceae bacterium]|nr:polyphosphate kinase 1 [Steroidobacteraceae bacterium]
MDIKTRDGMLREAWCDRDLSWLEFNRRVLAEALDERTPLLERFKFLAIFTSNLDEFFMKRVGAMRTRAYASGSAASIQEFTSHVLALRQTLHPMLLQQAGCFEELRHRLAKHHIHLANWSDLSDAQCEEVSAYFDKHVSPALTPLSLDPSQSFPFMSNLSTSWGFVLRDPEINEPVLARVKVPTTLPQWLPIKSGLERGERCFISLQSLVREKAAGLFPGVEIEQATLFRVSRNADIAIEEDSDNSIKELVEEQVRQRRFQPVVRLEFGESPSPEIRNGLVSRFELNDGDVYELPGMLDYTGLFEIASLRVPELRDSPWTPLPPPGINPEADIFSSIRAGDVLVHHPYDSFDASVERFIRDAASDANTTTIKMTVYRLGDDTPFVRSLIKAAENGKQVACLVELTARFDEERNLHWAEELQKAGDHVIYGVRGLKTHTKLALVVRREGEGLRSYAHIGTGNYHVKTARLYTDFGLFTCDPVLTRDVVNLFHHLTGYSRRPKFEKLLVAPLNMRERFIELILREAANARAGLPARIIAKLNQLEDAPVCAALCEASNAGVSIDVIARGFCCLRPGIPGWTENIRVRSIVGRFLEHGRLFHFANGREDPVDGEFYLGSADWMDRNLSRRVEAVAPVEVRALRERLWDVLQVQLADERNAWQMQPDGSYVQHRPARRATTVAREGSHVTLMKRTRARVKRHA